RRHTRSKRDWSSDVCSSDLEGGNYGMMTHGDRVHYAIRGLGTWETASDFADADPARELVLADLAGAGGPPPDWKGYGQGALASRSEERRVGKGGRCGGAAGE